MASTVQNVRLRRQDAQHRQTRRRLLTTAPDRALPTAVSSERMPTRAATDMTAQRAHLSPRAIASDGSHVTMPAAAAPVPTRHVGAGLLPARRARVSARTHVEPGPQARPMQSFIQ